MLDKDLALHRSYVCEDNGKIAATFAFTTDGEPTYRVIRGGAWLDDAPYGVVHRIAAAKGTHGAASVSYTHLDVYKRQVMACTVHSTSQYSQAVAPSAASASTPTPRPTMDASATVYSC